MNVLVIGVQGQLAQSLKELGEDRPWLSLQFIGRPIVDLANPGEAAAAVIERQPDLVVNAAAYTAVDAAETERELAMRINADAAGEIAAAANRIRARVIQISTDYVFDGNAKSPYAEDAPTNPLNVYGKSKLRGEDEVRLANPQHQIVRTSWVYSPFGRNFVTTMFRLARERDRITVVADQVGCPTSALDLADAILTIATSTEDWGKTIHVAGSGDCSWSEFARLIFDVSRQHGGPKADVIPIDTADYPTAARRPLYSVLDCRSYEQQFHRRLPSWQDSAALVVGRLLAV